MPVDAKKWIGKEPLLIHFQALENNKHVLKLTLLADHYIQLQFVR